MATELSPRRLRELLQLVCGSCEAASEAAHGILNAAFLQGRIGEWWKENSDNLLKALVYSYKAEGQMSNAATLCEQEWAGDAEQLRNARNELVNHLTKINEFYHAARGATTGPDWFPEQNDLWCTLLCRIAAAETAARSLLKSDSIACSAVDSGTAAVAGDDSPPKVPSEDDPFLTHIELATRYAQGREATRQKLNRWRFKNGDGWHEVNDRQANKPKYLYRLSAIRKLFEKS